MSPPTVFRHQGEQTIARLGAALLIGLMMASLISMQGTVDDVLRPALPRPHSGPMGILWDISSSGVILRNLIRRAEPETAAVIEEVPTRPALTEVALAVEAAAAPVISPVPAPSPLPPPPVRATKGSGKSKGTFSGNSTKGKGPSNGSPKTSNKQPDSTPHSDSRRP